MTSTNNSSLNKFEYLNKEYHQTSQDSIQANFLQDSSKINTREGQLGWTPLLRAIICENIEATSYLMKKGADPNIQSNLNETPLYYAVDLQNIEIIKILLNHNADPNITQNDGDSPLHIACTKQNYKIIELLLKHKANPNLKNNSLRTPMHYGIMHCISTTGVIYLLVQYGGCLITKDQQNNRPIDYIPNDEVRKAIDILKTKNESAFSVNNSVVEEPPTSNIVIQNKINHQIQQERYQSYKQDSFREGESSEMTCHRKISKESLNQVLDNQNSIIKKKSEISITFTSNDYNSFQEIKEEDHDDSFKENQVNEYHTVLSNGNNLNTFRNLVVKSEENSLRDNHDNSNEEDQENSQKRKDNLDIIRKRLNSIKSNKSGIRENSITDNTRLSIINNNIVTPKKPLNKDNNSFSCNQTERDLEIKLIGGHNTNNSIVNNSLLNIHNNQNVKPSIPTSMKKTVRYINEDNKENITPKADLFQRKLNFSIFNEKDEDKIYQTTKPLNRATKLSHEIAYKGNKDKSFNTIIIQDSGKKHNVSVDQNRVVRKLSNMGSNHNSDTVKHVYCKSLKSSNSSYVSKNQIKRLNEWLNSINLHIYFDNFLENGFTNLDLFIELAAKPNKINYEDLISIGISKPGHIFRILSRIEYDANLIQENLSFILNRGKHNDLLKNSIYILKNQFVCCASTKNRYNHNSFEMSLPEWLLKINMEHLRKNFSHNGYDSMEYLLMQMFSSYTIDDNFLENHLHIYENKDRILVLRELEKNVDSLKKFLRRQTGESIIEYEDENISQAADCKICLMF